MASFSPLGQKPRSIVVVGRHGAAVAVADALSRLPNVGNVRHLAGFDPLTDAAKLHGADVVVEMLGGVTQAFALAMAAMGAGVHFITANPTLMLVHGRVLRNAAAGQGAYLGFQAAGFGAPVAEMLAALRPTKMTACFTTAASVALARMAFRNESLAHVSAHLKMQGVDLGDWGGKQTLARAVAMRALVFGAELPAAALQRVAVEALDVADIKRLRVFGLQPVFGAEMTEDAVYAGPMAVAQGSALVQADARDVMLAETATGTVMVQQEADEEQRVVGGVVADVRALLRSGKPMMAVAKDYGFGGVVAALGGETLAYVRLPYGERERILALKPEILQEQVEGDGLWQAVVAVKRLGDIQITGIGGVVLPVAGDWAPVVAVERGLRLVG